MLNIKLLVCDFSCDDEELQFTDYFEENIFFGDKIKYFNRESTLLEYLIN